MCRFGSRAWTCVTCAKPLKPRMVSSRQADASGTVPEPKRPLYELACQKAMFVGTWLARDIHAAAAAGELGIAGQNGMDVTDLLRCWEGEIAFAQKHVSGRGCVFLCAFPGPRPWTPSACLCSRDPKRVEPRSSALLPPGSSPG
jgi:hypothetical protein